LPKNAALNQVEIENPTPVIDETGNINGGWARQPLISYDPVTVATPRRYVTAADRYVIFTPSFLFLYEIYDGGFLGFVNVTAVSLIDNHIATRTINIPFPLGDMRLPASSETGSTKIRHEKALLDFIIMDEMGPPAARIIKVDMPQVGHNRNLRGEVVLLKPQNAESLFVNSAFHNAERRFQFLRASPWWSVEGVMQYENTEMAFNKGKAWGVFYWTRIARPKTDMHYWAAGCGMSGGREIGFNLGYGMADSSAGTENAFFINGKLHKLELVTFQSSPAGWLKIWKFTSSDFRLDMVFYPVQQFARKSYMLQQLYRTRQVFGFFSGCIALDDGTKFHFERITGLVEQRNTWM
jgi:hypothetical protein